ncbi:MAG: phage tail protein [Bryobacteraceae bacterium]
MANDTRPFRYCNAGGQWPGFHWEGLQLEADGTLRLEPLPRLDGALPEPVANLPGSPPPGIAVDRDGTIFFSDCTGNRLLRMNGCSGDAETVPGVGADLNRPAGLVIPSHRRALYVADAGSGRVLVLHAESLQLLETIGGFEEPVSLAAGDDGSLYVADVKAHRVDRFSISGDRDPWFGQRVAESGCAGDPLALAEEDGVIYVLDGQTHNVCLFDAAGHLIEEADLAAADASVFTVIGGVLYVGDPGRRRIAVYRRDQRGEYAFAGDAAGYEGPVAALVKDGRGGLLVTPSCGVAPLRLSIDASYRGSGLLWSGAIALDTEKHFWNRVHADIETRPGSSFQFFVHTGPTSAPPPDPSPGPLPFPAPWRPVEGSIADFFVGGEPTQALWIGARLTNDLDATPELSQIRIDFDQDSYLGYLPAIYRERECGDFLLRFVSLFESFFDELEGRIDDIPALLGAASAPEETLPWLAGFLALPLPENWTEAQKRSAIAGTFARHARRGTVGGLREALLIEAGVHAVIDEPIQSMGWWSLPPHPASCKAGAAETWSSGTGASLGLNTVLASSEPQGAVAGTTATLDRSELIANAEYGMPLFEVCAFRFTVSVYPGEVDCPERMDRVISVIEREKPAHTMYELCVIQPGVRVGYRSRLGVDTLVGGGYRPTRLGEGGLVLDGAPRGQIGMRSMVGVDTQL